MTRTLAFLSSEDGAITVDWVVLTAALSAFGLLTVAIVTGGVEDVSRDTEAHLASIDPGSLHNWSSIDP